jgi:hypothetical protein
MSMVDRIVILKSHNVVVLCERASALILHKNNGSSDRNLISISRNHTIFADLPMKPSKKNEVSVMDFDFQQTAERSDKSVFAHIQFICRSGKRSPVPNTIKSNAYRVTRTP